MRKFILAFAMSIGSLSAWGQNFDKMWAEVQSLQDNGKPQSAYAATEKILKKAIREGHQGHALSARLKMAGLHQEWAPDSFFTDVTKLETLRREEPKPEARAIYASILAYIYEVNRNRTHASGLEMTSENMHEWTTEQYDSAALANWQQSLADVPLLGQARSKDWLPFIAQSAHSSYFHHDLLHILWQRMRDQRRHVWGQTETLLSSYAKAIRDEYARLGNREATLLMELDLAQLEQSHSNTKAHIARLTALAESYADLPLCTEVYLQLLDTDAPDSMKVEWAKHALRRYPRYDRIGLMQNRLNSLFQPQITWEGCTTCYPGKTYIWNLQVKNASKLNAEVLQLPDDFDELELNKPNKDIRTLFLQRGKVIQKITHSIENPSPYQENQDSMTWTAPGIGRYVVLFTASTNEPEARQLNINQYYEFIRVTALTSLQFQSDDGNLEFVVVDAESGHPVKGATVQCHTYQTRRKQQQELVGAKLTDDEGRTHFNLIADNHGYSLKMTYGNDRWAPEQVIWKRSAAENERSRMELQLYTDRAIYRPGQTVHVSGVVFSQQHWDAEVVANKEFTLLLRDANWKEVGKQTVKTDSMGVLAATFALPYGGLPGMYHIDTNLSAVHFRVEEYKRPTFEVKMDEAPALQWPQDSIILTGKAIGYNGVPVRNGRVTGRYQFTYPYWWYRHNDSPRMNTDTVWTDETGAFIVKVPLKDIPSEALIYGLQLTLEAEVMSAVGETHEGYIRITLCTTPLRLRLNMQEKQDRERVEKPAISLLTSTGKASAGTVFWRILPAEADKEATALKEGTIELPAIPTGSETESLAEIISRLPSGRYELHAVAQSGQDTASAKASFYVFGMSDKHMPFHKESWFYCPDASFDAEHPARIQLGSSFDDVVVYYRVESKNGTIENRLIQLSDELQTVEIPYLNEYADGVMVYAAFVKHGHEYTWSQPLRLRQPSYRLKWEWTSFRDHTHPGAQETWTLRLTNPDGTPSPANVMATIYDASLDQLYAHQWNFGVNRFHELPSRPWYVYCPFNEKPQLFITFPMKSRKVPNLSFDGIDSKWTDGITFGSGYRLRGRIAGLGSAHNEVYMMKAAAPAAMKTAITSNDAMSLEEASAVKEVVADMDAGTNNGMRDPGLSDATIQAQGNKVGTAIAEMRTNFNETAAFMPRLHTNPQTGEVTLSFTLPESLTTWQLLGIAHTGNLLTTEIQAQTIARKEMMASLHLPRFLRAGDQGIIGATIQNLTDQSLSGTALLEVFDPETENLLLSTSLPFEASAQDQSILSFAYTPTEACPIVAVRLTATTSMPEARKNTQHAKHKKHTNSGNSISSENTFTDGEQCYLPILSDQTWITESVEIQADSIGSYTTDLSALFNKDNPNATHRRLTVEYTTHPIWNVVQALPVLREPQHDDIISLTSVCYANTLAAHIAATTPRLKDIITLWKQQDEVTGTSANISPSSSPLSRNEELKNIILNETPWLREANNDSERRAQLIDLFNESLLEQRIGTSFQRLAQRQQTDGGFPWFPGMRSSEIMTRITAMELTHLRTLTDDFSTLTEESRQQANKILQKAFSYLAKQTAIDVETMRKSEAKGSVIHTASLMHLHYVYITQKAGIRLSKSQQADVRYLLDHLKGSVAGMDNAERAMAAIVLKTDGRTKEARIYYDALREHATTTQAHGTFFDYAGGSFTPTGQKIVIHTTAMEAAETMEGMQTALIRGMRRWLLQQKRTQMWESSICTTNAIYALLHGNEAELTDSASDRITLDYGRSKTRVEPTPAINSDDKDARVSPAALGYIRQTYSDGRAPRAIIVERHSPTEGWGAVYAQYLTPVAAVSAQSTGLSIRRELSNKTPQLGERITTRYIITADRDYEYVCLRADRTATAEPSEQLSGYQIQGGLCYYRAVHDAHTDYFFDRLPKGTYVLEEAAYIDRNGDYSTGLCRIQCLYAPEFEGHTGAERVQIKDKK